MIAIPVDSATMEAKSSKLFGNVNFFAVYNEKEKNFFFLNNKEAGNGISTAEFLNKWGVRSVVYSYMGNGPFGSLCDNNIDVFYIGKEPLALTEIVDGVQNGKFTQVTPSNAKELLDPGTSSGDCSCGCSHE